MAEDPTRGSSGPRPNSADFRVAQDREPRTVIRVSATVPVAPTERNTDMVLRYGKNPEPGPDPKPDGPILEPRPTGPGRVSLAV